MGGLPFDPSVPNIARVYDYLLGGKDNWDADREMGDRVEELYPPVRDVLRIGRAWIGRVVTWAMRQGVTQIIDLGAGLPTSPAVHSTAQVVVPGARVAYVDHDPLVISHVRARYKQEVRCRRVAAVAADLAGPEAVTGHPDLLAVIDPARPVLVLCGLVLHFYDGERAREICAGYARLIAPGSLVAVSVIRNDDAALLESMRDVLAAVTELHNHTAYDVAGFLAGAGLEMVLPGVVPARAWRGGMPDPGLGPSGAAHVLAGVARKPRL